MSQNRIKSAALDLNETINKEIHSKLSDKNANDANEEDDESLEDPNELAPHWITGDWSKTCRLNPCKSNQTRVVKCSSDTIKCNQSVKPNESKPCSIPVDLICKSRVHFLFSKVMQFFEELFKSENLIA